MCDRHHVSASASPAVVRRTLITPWTTEVSVRVGGLLLCLAIAALTGVVGATWRQLVALLCIAVVASIPARPLWLRYALILGEAAAVAVVLVLSPGFLEPILPYLLVPPLVAGIAIGVVGVLAAAGISALVLVAGTYLAPGSASPGSTDSLALWLGLAVVMGLLGVALRATQSRLDRRPTSYATANRLLTSLRDVARQLPTGLDEVSLAQGALTRLRGVIDADRAALYSRSDAGQLVPLAFAGADRIEWDASTTKGIWGQAWNGGLAVQRLGSFSRPVRGVSAVLPLRIGDRRTGLVAIERDGPAWTIREMAAAQTVVDEAALRINSGQLFSEVRALATVEERRRLAREIHDGIAQEVAALGFYVDDLIHRADTPDLRDDLTALRDELTRLVTELRLSIFDLRSDVQPGVGLGAALSSYVRSVGTGSGITVHLVLDEASARLGPEAESELLRIAQEAVTNARKHAEARNLWVTCRVDPPRAFLRVADDGRGMGTARPDSYGLEIMRERAGRLGATLTIRPRVGGGTVVEVAVGTAGDSPATTTSEGETTPVASTPT